MDPHTLRIFLYYRVKKWHKKHRNVSPLLDGDRGNSDAPRYRTRYKYELREGKGNNKMIEMNLIVVHTVW